MCAVYNDYVAKKMKKDEENMDLIPQGALVQNVFKNMNICNFVTLVMIADFSTKTITKVLESLRIRKSFIAFSTLVFLSFSGFYYCGF